MGWKSTERQFRWRRRRPPRFRHLTVGLTLPLRMTPMILDSLMGPNSSGEVLSLRHCQAQGKAAAKPVLSEPRERGCWGRPTILLSA